MVKRLRERHGITVASVARYAIAMPFVVLILITIVRLVKVLIT